MTDTKSREWTETVVRDIVGMFIINKHDKTVCFDKTETLRI